MEMNLLKFFLLNFILLMQIHAQKACVEEERMGLLELKSFVKLEGYYSDSVFHSWVDDLESDCCGWERVTCNSTTGRVIQLSLYNLGHEDPAPCIGYVNNGDGGYFFVFSNPEPRFWNITLFKPFKELRIVDLSYNLLDGWIQDQGLLRLEKLETLDLTCNNFTSHSLQSSMSLAYVKNLILRHNGLQGSFPANELSVFENLETLDLSENSLSDSPTKLDMESLSKLRYLTLHSNEFNKDIMKFLGSLPSLRSLDLSSNRLEGSLSNHELANLSNLEVLHLEDNDLSGSLPIKDLITFRRLEILDLRHNKLAGSIPPDIGKLSSLEVLYLSSNELNGSLPDPGLCELRGLQKLDIGVNNFEGILPQCLNNLTSLRILDVHDNSFSGSISSYLISSPKSLQFIDFSINYFEGSFLFSSIFNHSKLEIIVLGSKENKLQIDIENRDWNPQFQLKALGLSDCNLNNAPTFLLNQHRLEVVDLSHNKLNGKFPSWLLENNTDLKFLNLRNNSFTGGFHIPQHPKSVLISIDLSYNHLGGQLPKDLGRVLSNLKVLNLSMNDFEADLPTSIGGIKQLVRLDLSSNNFLGEVPRDLVQNCTDLRVLMLSNNNFHGEFFSTRFNLANLQILGLRNNQFTGSLTNIEYHGGRLFLFDVSNNNMTGKIPSWIYKIGPLAMRNNYFEGQLPACNRPFIGSFIDLSYNFLSGPLPSCFNMESMQQIHLAGNKFTGSIPNALLNSSSLLVLNLRGNSLSGKIPADLIGSLPSLSVLSLGKNQLSGSIPRWMCHLRKIRILDLSKNSFFGSIPNCLSNISFGTIDNFDQIIDKTDIAIGVSNLDVTIGTLQISELVHNIVLADEDEGWNAAFSFGASLTEIEIDFVTKANLLSYKHDILNYMSGLDLSCNNLSGEIPQSIGKLFSIRAVNLSHNHLTGSIPVSFSNLTKVESLDLSYNSLSGKIPSELVSLNFLAVFSVAHNNLSGSIPDKGQFATFDSSSYEGNPFLSRPPSEKNHTIIVEPLPDEGKEKWYEIDHNFFFASFTATYFVFLLGFVAILYINPYWRRRWFYFIENFLCSSYYFVVDTLHKLSTNFNN